MTFHHTASRRRRRKGGGGAKLATSQAISLSMSNRPLATRLDVRFCECGPSGCLRALLVNLRLLDMRRMLLGLRSSLFITDDAGVIPGVCEALLVTSVMPFSILTTPASHVLGPQARL